jgi:transcriptional regulator with XRE-family HTH domain
MRLTLQQIGPLVKDKRGDRGIREVAAEIGVSPATLSRVERGKLPDLDTFSKLCSWLRVDPAEVLGIDRKLTRKHTVSADTNPMQVHFRAHKNLSPKAATALAELILATQRLLSEERGS